MNRIALMGLVPFLKDHETDIAAEGRNGKDWGRLTHAFFQLLKRWPGVAKKRGGDGDV